MATICVTGATGLIGQRLVELLHERGYEICVLSRDAESAKRVLPVQRTVAWAKPDEQIAPAEAFEDCDAVINLLGEPINQRWTEGSKQRMRSSRVDGTRNLVKGLQLASSKPHTLISQSASGFYGPRGSDPVDETEQPVGGDFLSELVTAWEQEALEARKLGIRVITPRTGVVLSASGGALSKMLLPFRLGLGGPVAGGRQYVPWVNRDDVCEALCFLLEHGTVDGAVNLCAPEPVTNLELSKTLGRVLNRPALLPVPAFALGLVYGEMASLITTGARMIPQRLQSLGYSFKHPELEDALRAEL
jgi:uncharacterized protein (TIGR01777 family)